MLSYFLEWYSLAFLELLCLHQMEVTCTLEEPSWVDCRHCFGLDFWTYFSSLNSFSRYYFRIDQQKWSGLAKILFYVFENNLELNFSNLGVPLGRNFTILWIHHVGHSNDHWETQTRRQGLHRPFVGFIHWLYANLQKSPHFADAKGM